MCSSHFITVAHLDMHMAQTDHLYLCPLCPFTCATGIDLRDHCDTAHPSDEPSSSKSYRIVNPVPAVTTRSTVKPTPTAGRTVVAPTAREEQRRADNRLHQTDHLYLCPLCPFTCATGIDLRDHCDTAHPSDEPSSSKSYRIVNPVPAVTTRSTVKPTPTAGRTVVAPTAREEQRRADNRLHQTDHLYLCPLCPFTCATGIDLRDHCDTAHPSDEPSSRRLVSARLQLAHSRRTLSSIKKSGSDIIITR
uniref:C2H2-type domain-containing protein n=1 Tax=Trichobilharzia regenti TaxID=157069 RepID=A0AA85IY00_TRIRE|nr:unnamed protein product [Trichobilharzia regenti]